MFCKLFQLLDDLEVRLLVGRRFRHAATCPHCAARVAGLSSLRAGAGRLSPVSDRFVAAVRRDVRSRRVAPSARARWMLPVGLAMGAAVAVGVTLLVSRPSKVMRDVAAVPSQPPADLGHGVAQLADALTRVPRAIPWEDAHDYLELSSAVAEGRLPRLRAPTAGAVPERDPTPGAQLAQTLDPLCVVNTAPWQNLARRFGVDRFTRD